MKTAVRFFCLFTLVLALNGSFRTVPVMALGTTFTVNRSSDLPDINPGDGICDDGLGGCTLRAAIQQASTVGGPVSINFDSGLAGPIILNLGPIDWVADHVTLDGGEGYVTISGAGLYSGQAVFTISGSYNLLSHLVIRAAPYDGVQVGDFSGAGGGNYNTITQSILVGNGAAGVYVHGTSGGGQHNSISQVYIGSTRSDESACSNDERNGGDGVYIDGPAFGTSITSSTITCNVRNGIFIYGGYGSPTDTLVQDGYIGLNGAGAMPNGGQGVRDLQGSNTNLVSNVISGNLQDGVALVDSSGAILHNNYIGTNAIGISALPNGGNGVLVTNGATNNSVGGYASSSDRNVISGNAGCGVSLQAEASGNLVDANLVGLDVTGMNAVPNGQAGVCLENASNNTIGSSAAGVSQYISGNAHEGLLIQDSSNTFIGPTNRIGVGLDDITPRGNGRQGILLDGATNSLVYPSILSNNGLAGAAVVGNSATGNHMAFLTARDNGGLPVDLGNDGPTSNGTHSPPGPNDWLPYPVITSTSGSPVTLHGMTCALCSVLVYKVTRNPAADGGGGTYLNEIAADASGNWSFTLPPGMSRGQVSLAAFKPLAGLAGDSSEMSPTDDFKQYLPLVVK